MCKTLWRQLAHTAQTYRKYCFLFYRPSKIHILFLTRKKRKILYLLHINSMREWKNILQNFYQEPFFDSWFFLRRPASCLNDCPRPEVVKVVLIWKHVKNYFKLAFMSCRFFYVNVPFTRFSFQICIILNKYTSMKKKFSLFFV